MFIANPILLRWKGRELQYFIFITCYRFTIAMRVTGHNLCAPHTVTQHIACHIAPQRLWLDLQGIEVHERSINALALKMYFLLLCKKKRLCWYADLPGSAGSRIMHNELALL